MESPSPPIIDMGLYTTSGGLKHLQTETHALILRFIQELSNSLTSVNLNVMTAQCLMTQKGTQSPASVTSGLKCIADAFHFLHFNSGPKFTRGVLFPLCLFSFSILVFSPFYLSVPR